MKKEKINRIVFYSKEDMASTYHLKNAEILLNDFEQNDFLQINDLFEFYNIKLYFENDIYLKIWSEEKKKEYQEIVEQNWLFLKGKLIEIDNDCIHNIINELEYDYKENFWDLINNLNIYKKINNPTFENILNNDNYLINYILRQKGIVEKFDRLIRKFLISYKTTAEILLSKFEEKSSDNSPKYYFPKSLSLVDKEKIILSYLEYSDANINYVRLIENSKDSNELKLSAKTRLKSKKKSKELNNEILESGNSWNVRIQVGLSKDQSEPVKFNNSQGGVEATYSEKFIDKLNDDYSLFYVFKHLFGYTDETNLITLVNKNKELDVLEKIFMKSKNIYETGEVFNKKEYLSILQLFIFENYLSRNNNSVENLINSFIDDLNKLIFPSKLIFKIRNSTSSYLEKIRNIIPDYEFLLKQFKTYSEEGEIDLELIQINSKPNRFSEIISLSDRKYVYINNDLAIRLKHLFFSDQSHLYYTEKFGTKYKNLYDLLNNENIELNEFQNYQQNSINSLISDGYLRIDKNNFVKITQDILLYVIRELHRNEVLNYWNYPSFVREEIDKMFENHLIKFENTLLTINERNYFNYYLNKKEFTNGSDLRNKYSHGTNSFSENEHKNDYYTLIRIIILTLMKIEDDILIKNKSC